MISISITWAHISRNISLWFHFLYTPCLRTAVVGHCMNEYFCCDLWLSSVFYRLSYFIPLLYYAEPIQGHLLVMVSFLLTISIHYWPEAIYLVLWVMIIYSHLHIYSHFVSKPAFDGSYLDFILLGNSKGLGSLDFSLMIGWVFKI